MGASSRATESARLRSRRRGCQALRGGAGSRRWGRNAASVMRNRGRLHRRLVASVGLVLLAGGGAWWWEHRAASFALPDRLPVDRVVAELAAALPDSSGVRRAPLAPR